MRHDDTRREQVRRGRGLDGGTADLLRELDGRIRPTLDEMDARIRPVLDEFGGARSVPLFEILDDGELRAWVRGFRAGKRAAAEAGKVAGCGAC